MKHEILELAQEAHSRRAEVLKVYTDTVNRQHKISCNTCKKDYCCYQMVGVPLFEAVIIADWILRNGRSDILIELRKQGRDQVELLTNRGGLTVRNIIKYHDEICGEWFDQQRPCPFLSKGRCLIYPIRPSSCSSHCVITPPEQCAPPKGGAIGKVSTEQVFIYMTQIDEVFVTLLGAKITQIMPFYMGTMVDLALDLLKNGVGILDGRKFPLNMTLEDANERRLVRDELARRTRKDQRSSSTGCGPQSVGEVENSPDTPG